MAKLWNRFLFYAAALQALVQNFLQIRCYDVVSSAYDLGLTPFGNSHVVLGGSKVKDGGEAEL